jgi:uncharacterized membrane protein
MVSIQNMNTSDPSASTYSVTTEDKTTAIVSYLTLIGFIVAVILHGNKKTRLGAYHLRQALGLMLSFIAVGFFWMVPFIGWLVGFCAWIGLIVLWIMGLVAAINGQQKPVPLIGDLFQKWFGTAFD